MMDKRLDELNYTLLKFTFDIIKESKHRGCLSVGSSQKQKE